MNALVGILDEAECCLDRLLVGIGMVDRVSRLDFDLCRVLLLPCMLREQKWLIRLSLRADVEQS